MSQAGSISSGGGGGSGIMTIDGDTGSITGSTVTIFANGQGGSTVNFTNSGTVSTLSFTDSRNNTFLGIGSGNASNTTNGSTALGYMSLNAISSGISNTCVGHFCGNTISTGQLNTAVGEGALFNCSSSISNVVAIGWHTLIGASGSGSIGIGFNCMTGGVSGSNNIGIGDTCLLDLTSGNDNICIGMEAGEGIVASSSNIFLGTQAGAGITTGSNSVVIGHQSAIAVSGNQSASNNCYIGYQSAENITSGSQNCGMGYQSLNLLNSGNYNSCYGYQSGISYVSSESSNICIGSLGTVGDNNVMRLGTTGTGNGEVSTTFVAGVNGVPVTGTAVLCSTTGQLGTIVSSIRYKESVKCIDESVSVLGLRPVSFNYKEDKQKTKMYGLIAEEVDKDFPYLCFYNEKGEPESVKYHELATLLLNEIQKLNKRIQQLESEK